MKKVIYILITVSLLILLPSCTIIRHHQVTKKTQRWESKQFNPVRKSSKKLIRKDTSKKTSGKKKDKSRKIF